MLPEGLVLVFTSASMLLIDAPGFAAAVGAVERDGLLPKEEVAPGTIRWRITWHGVENITLDDDVVVIRPKVSSPPLEVRCFPGTPQAREVLLIAKKIRQFYDIPHPCN